MPGIPETNPTTVLAAGKPAAIDSARLTEVADELVKGAHRFIQSAEELIKFLVRQTGAEAGLLFRSTSENEFVVELDCSPKGQASDRAFVLAARSAMSETVRGGKVVISQLARTSSAMTIISCPVISEGGSTKVLVLILKADRKDALEPAMTVLQWAAEMMKLRLSGLQEQARSDKLERALKDATALSDLVTRSAGTLDMPHAAHTLAGELRNWVGCDEVILARTNMGRCKVIAISGAIDISKRSEASRSAEIVMNFAAQRKQEISCLGEITESSAETAPFLDELKKSFEARHFFAAALTTSDGSTSGAWLFIWKKAGPLDLHFQNFLHATNPHIATHLTLLGQGKPGALGGSVRRIWKKATVNQRKAVMISLGALFLILVAPISYRIKARSELQPVIKRVVAAPFDATLRKSVAQAGQTVKTGDLLAELDGREIRTLLAEVVAKGARAAKEAEKATTEGDIAAARMAELEAQSLAEETKLLEYKRDNLEVRAPIAGVVISEDLDRAEGVPLKTGDALYEIAPLEQMIAEVLVEESEIALVAPGMPVEVRLESDPGKIWKGKISRVAPRSELRDLNNVFVCEAVLENKGLELRPGMKGWAKVYAARRPLIWNFTRRAWFFLRMKLW